MLDSKCRSNIPKGLNCSSSPNIPDMSCRMLSSVSRAELHSLNGRWYARSTTKSPSPSTTVTIHRVHEHRSNISSTSIKDMSLNRSVIKPMDFPRCNWPRHTQATTASSNSCSNNKSTNQANSAFHPFRVNKISSKLQSDVCYLSQGGAIW